VALERFVLRLSDRTRDALSEGEVIAEVAGAERLPHARMRTTTVQALHACGYEVVPSDWRGHATIVLPGPATVEDWQNLQESFGAPIDNPVGRSRRKPE
jgi:alpha-beta hydrolase superfamily lysophospholipase